ncbi:hypothetical protein RUM44_008366 [Polyplax serrata]|uniref:Uncharacterized protein n=1 Tax=Polyplax serrata TaxID=468196 RepID=A0ABR1B826_POLSC
MFCSEKVTPMERNKKHGLSGAPMAVDIRARSPSEEFGQCKFKLEKWMWTYSLFNGGPNSYKTCKLSQVCHNASPLSVPNYPESVMAEIIGTMMRCAILIPRARYTTLTCNHSDSRTVYSLTCSESKDSCVRVTSVLAVKGS